MVIIKKEIRKVKEHKLNVQEIFIDIFFFIITTSECVPGFSGQNCTRKCPIPTYGKRCQNVCKCKKDQCDVSSGCSTLFDGIYYLFFNRKFTFI